MQSHRMNGHSRGSANRLPSPKMRYRLKQFYYQGTHLKK